VSEPHHARRHSMASAQVPIPITDKGYSLPTHAHPDLNNAWATYSGELRSPTQRSNDLLRATPSVLNDLAPPPELTRNQSRSADSTPKYLLHDHHFGPVIESNRERSVSQDKDRPKSGRPPQHVRTSISSPLILSSLARDFICRLVSFQYSCAILYRWRIIHSE
jgi:hypothetical protein